MKTFANRLFATLILGLTACGSLTATTLTLMDLPQGDTDTISIQLNPSDGAVSGVAGASVGWGFTVNWTSTEGDWVSFTSSSLGSITQAETNPDLVASYNDLIGQQGGPVDFSLSPGSWTEPFDGAMQGVGVYQITSDPTIAVPSAEDTGEITFDFQVYNGDPFAGGTQIGDGSYAYFGSSSEFSVTVEAPSLTPESPSWLLLGGALLTLLGRLGARKAQRTSGRLVA